jgi:hypothetical protein
MSNAAPEEVRKMIKIAEIRETPLLEPPQGGSSWAEVRPEHVLGMRVSLPRLAGQGEWEKYGELAANMVRLGIDVRDEAAKHRAKLRDAKGFRSHVDNNRYVRHKVNLKALGLEVDPDIKGEEKQKYFLQGLAFHGHFFFMESFLRMARSMQELGYDLGEAVEDQRVAIDFVLEGDIKKGEWASVGCLLADLKFFGQKTAAEAQKYGKELAEILKQQAEMAEKSMQEEKTETKKEWGTVVLGDWWVHYSTHAVNMMELGLLTPKSGKDTKMPPLKRFGR